MAIAFHVLAGFLALLTGYLALSTAKGGPSHRRSGRWFACAMLAMAASGTALALVRNEAPGINVPAGLLTAYLTVTALATVRPAGALRHGIERVGMVVAIGGGLASLAYGVASIAAGRPAAAIVVVVFGSIALAAGLGDLRMLRAGAPTGAPRLRRHLWRACTALLIASLAFFAGQADEFPSMLRVPALLAIPPLAVLAAMLLWLWRLRRGQVPAAAASRPSPSWLARRRLDLDDDDFGDEIRAHLAMAEAEARASGLSAEAARHAARRQFGNLTLTTEAARRVWMPHWLEVLRDLASDARYSARALAGRPAFSLTVIAVLALGIGVNAAVFTMLKSIALTPLSGVRAASSLSVVYTETSTGRAMRLSYPDYQHLRDHTRAFDTLFGSVLAQVTLGRGRHARQVSAEFVTGNYFEGLGVGAHLGRTLLPSDEAAEGPQPIVVISDGLWRRDFAADPSIVGRSIVINARPLTVVGVADPAYHGTIVSYDIELFIPVTIAPDLGFTFGSRGLTAAEILTDRRATVFNPHGRLRPGTSRAAAAAELRAAWDSLDAARQPDEPSRRLRIVPFRSAPGSGQTFILPTLMVLSVMGLLVLLIACTNIAGLVLVRGLARRGEIGVRLALGATRWRIVRLLVIETLTLAVPGAALGLLLSWNGIPPLVRYAEWLAAPQRLFFNIELDAGIIGFAALVACASALVVGFAPALQSARIDLVSVLNADASPRGAPRGRARAALVVAQVAVSLLLLVGAGLAMRSVEAARRVDPGFDRSGVGVLELNVRQQGYETERGRAFYRALVDAARTATGIESATLAEHTPLGLLDTRARSVDVDGHVTRRGEDLAMLSNAIGPAYFRTMRIPLVAGREFVDHDDERGPAVAVVNRTLAERFFGTAAAAIGRRVRFAGEGWRTIVGVAADVKYARIDEAPRPYLYVPFLQAYRPTMLLHVRTAGPVEAALERARGLVERLDPELAVLKAATLAHETRGAFLFFDLLATLLPIFGITGMLLAAMGTYGLVSFVVAQSTHEIGIRMALGASRSSVVRAFLARGLRLGVAGAALGLVAALVVSRFVVRVLFGVGPSDPVSFAIALAVVLGAVVVATLLPAWRASRVDPLRALRHG